MTMQEMLKHVQAQLAVDLNCTVDDLNAAPETFVFVEARENPGRRPFPRGEQHFEMLIMGRATVVSATPALLAVVRPRLQGLGRDEAFALPFVQGHSLNFLPDPALCVPCAPPTGFVFELAEQGSIPALYKWEGFENALQYNAAHPRPDVLAVLAKDGDTIVGMAGACRDSAKLWQVGMDVLPAYRGRGLATYLIARLTQETLRRGFIPYYSTASSNLASRRVAHRAGYAPVWMCAYQGRFDGIACLPTC